VKKLVIVIVLTVAAVACAKSSTTVAPPGSSTTPSSSPTPTPTSIGTTKVSIYYLVSFKNRLFLAPERHVAARNAAIARTAVEELVHGTAQDPDHTTPFPRSARINSVTTASGVATVDWSADVLAAGVGAQVEALGIQSVVYTLTGFPSIKKVRFTVEGKDHGTASNGRTIEDWWGHSGLRDQPWVRDPAIDVLEPITLFSPLDGATSAGTLRLSGEASTFEATVGIVVRNMAGRAVLRTSTTASIGAPARGSFSKTIRFAVPSSVETWTLEVYEESAEDGSVVFMETRRIVAG
jgi:germination protein M